MEGSKFLGIRPNVFNLDMDGYNYTKVLGLKCFCGNREKLIRKQPTTWASLAREVVNSFSYEIEKAVEDNCEAFEKRFNTALKEVIGVWGGKTNMSFSEELFTVPTHIKSVVYKNNQNSMLEIFRTPMGEPRYITAVYSGEVVWVLYALITALEDYDAWIEIEYIHREDLARELNSINIEESEKQLSIDDIPSNNEDSLEQDENIEDIQGNANLYITLLKVKLDALDNKYDIDRDDYNDILELVLKIERAHLKTAISVTSCEKSLESIQRYLGY